MLTVDQKLVLAKLVETGSVRETAEQAGLAKSTIYQWMRSTEFNRELAAASQLSLIQMINGAYSSIGDSLETVTEIAQLDPSIPISSDEARVYRLKLSASNSLLDRAERLAENLGIMSRINDIQDKLDRE